ncbi:MAG: hypothetical protein ACO25F_08685, partial [Erythrobacter sp.]
YRVVGLDSGAATATDVLLSAVKADGTQSTVNTDADSIGIGNQSIGAGETVRIDFLNGITTDATAPLTPTQLNWGSQEDTSFFRQTIPQVQGNQPETAAINVYAIDSTLASGQAPDSNPAGGFSDGDTVVITEVTVTKFNDATPLTPTVTFDLTGATNGQTFTSGGITVTFHNVGGETWVTIAGLQEKDQYSIDTGSNTFNAVAVTVLDEAGGSWTADDLDLGIFSIGSFNAGTDIRMNFNVTATDEDGDTATGTIEVSVDQDGSSLLAPLAAGTSSGSTQTLSSFSTETVLYGDTGTTGGGKGGGNGGKTNFFVNDNDTLSEQLSLRSFNTAFTATAAFGAMMVNFGEMGSTFDNLSTMSFDGFAFGGAESFQMGGYQSFEMQAFSADAWLPQVQFETAVSEYGYHGHNASFEFGGIGELASFEASAFEVAAANDFLSDGPAFNQSTPFAGGLDAGSTMMEALFALTPDAGSVVDLAGASGLAEAGVMPKLAGIVEDLMASQAVDNLIDQFAGPANEFVGLANENGYLGHDALASMIETGAFSIGGGIAADMHEDAAALATMHA